MLSKTKKSGLSKSWPQLIIVEGFWRMGKTTFINELAKQEKFTLISEPNHLVDEPKISDPHKWYFERHLERQKIARQLIEEGKKVVMERSILSSFAFNYAQGKAVTKDDKDILIGLLELKQSLIVFLYADERFIKREAQELKDHFVRDIVVKDKKFYQNYLDFYKNTLNEVVGSVLCLNVAPNGKFLNPGELVGCLKKNETI